MICFRTNLPNDSTHSSIDSKSASDNQSTLMAPKLSLSDFASNQFDTKEKKETKETSSKDIIAIKNENYQEITQNPENKEIRYKLSPSNTHLKVIKEEIRIGKSNHSPNLHRK